MQHQDQKSKIHRKRKNCDICNKKFNKEETYNKHMHKEHQKSQKQNN